MGGMFAASGILAALRERELTGRGKLVKSALFENTVFLVGQHMAQYAITGEAPPPMSVKRPAWGVYDIFETADDRLFVGVVTDTQWLVFCREFGLTALGADARLKTNTQRVAERGWLLPKLGEVFKGWQRAELEKKLEAIGLPYAPITRPQDLFDDPHLNASGGLMEMNDPRGYTFRAPALPLELDGKRLGKRSDPPHIGEGGRELLAGLGYGAGQIDSLVAAKVLAVPA
jgi:crotonobetainyl-CoA:carnitine CoA-transferase CaiB-like acyl-CoA transferase